MSAIQEGSDQVLVDTPETGIARITLNRPTHMNALTPEMRESLRERVVQALADAAVRVLILTGSGGQFCASGDIARLAALPKAEVVDLLRSAHRLIRALIESEKPVVAALPGVAAGGGAGLALACDTVLMAESASLVLPFHRLGLVADYGLAYTLPRRIGVARAHQFLLRPERIDAPRALVIGLADQITSADQLQDTALVLARRMAEQSPLALAWTKRLMLAQCAPLDRTLDLEIEAQRHCFASPEFEQGAAAFLAKANRS